MILKCIKLFLSQKGLSIDVCGLVGNLGIKINVLIRESIQILIRKLIRINQMNLGIKGIIRGLIWISD